MKTLFAFLVLLLTSAAYTQTAVVVQLDPADALALQQAYKSKLDAAKAYEDLRATITTRVNPRFRIQDGRPIATVDSRFAFGVEFSEDFQFAVPKQPPTYTFCGTSLAPMTPELYLPPDLSSGPNFSLHPLHDTLTGPGTVVAR